MLGRVRVSPSNSLEELELERLPSKILKDDSLSIYEHTLMKLKQGSQNALSSPIEDAMNTSKSYTTHGHGVSPNDEAMMPEADCSSSSMTTTTSPSSSNCQSVDTLSEHHKRNVSVRYMFSRYKSSRHALNSPNEESSVIEDGSSFSSASPSSCDCQLMSSTI
ncbi:hypothetical protein LguiB_008003 [Lonicera macranthoides]